MSNRSRGRSLALLVCLVLLALTPPAVLRLRKSYASRVFRRFVFDPVPKSVKEIRTDRDWQKVTGHRYVLRFTISQPDLALILNSRPFKQVEWAKYENGSLEWRQAPPWERQNVDLKNLRWKTEAMGLYPPDVGSTWPWWLKLGRTQPSWFKLGSWQNPKVYVLKENLGRGHWQILLYNAELSEAYFVERKWAH